MTLSLNQVDWFTQMIEYDLPEVPRSIIWRAVEKLDEDRYMSLKRMMYTKNPAFRDELRRMIGENANN